VCRVFHEAFANYLRNLTRDEEVTAHRPPPEIDRRGAGHAAIPRHHQPDCRPGPPTPGRRRGPKGSAFVFAQDGVERKRFGKQSWGNNRETGALG